MNRPPARSSSFVLLIVLALMIGAFQNCGEFAAVARLKSHSASYNFSSMAPAELQPSSDKVDADCMTKTDYDACLFQKNPVAQSKAAITGEIATANYDTIQIYGVKLTGVDGSGKLDDGTIHVESLKSPPVVTSQKQTLKSKAQNDADRAFSQVNVYYWLNRTLEYMGVRTGVFQARGKSIRVVVDDTLTGWSPATNSIHLRIADTGTPMSFSPELAIHFLALANLHYATAGAIEPPSPTRHRTCALKANGCCISELGCSRAIASGVGDYFAAVMFPDQPTLGEAWANDPAGIKNCGVGRNLDANSSLRASTAFSACASSSDRSGDVVTLGAVYASIWWQVRKAAATRSATGAQEIDTLFMNHLYDLEADDDFKSIRAKIRDLDTMAFNGKHVDLFEAQFSARGL